MNPPRVNLRKTLIILSMYLSARAMERSPDINAANALSSAYQR